jgi:hypothetical protein
MMTSHRCPYLADSLMPGSSALVVILEDQWLAELSVALDRQDAQVLAGDIEVEIAQAVRANDDVVYAVATTGDAIFANRAKGKRTVNRNRLVMHDRSYATC